MIYYDSSRTTHLKSKAQPIVASHDHIVGHRQEEDKIQSFIDRTKQINQVIYRMQKCYKPVQMSKLLRLDTKIMEIGKNQVISPHKSKRNLITDNEYLETGKQRVLSPCKSLKKLNKMPEHEPSMRNAAYIQNSSANYVIKHYQAKQKIWVSKEQKSEILNTSKSIDIDLRRHQTDFNETQTFNKNNRWNLSEKMNVNKQQSVFLTEQKSQILNKISTHTKSKIFFPSIQLQHPQSSFKTEQLMRKSIDKQIMDIFQFPSNYCGNHSKQHFQSSGQMVKFNMEFHVQCFNETRKKLKEQVQDNNQCA